MRDFRKYKIWNEGIQLVVECYHLTGSMPKEEEFGLKRQIRRAAVSIPSNIAEGASRSSQKEFKHFLEISMGSSFEVETGITIAEKLAMISDDYANDFLLRVHSHQMQMNTLINRIRTSD